MIPRDDRKPKLKWVFEDNMMPGVGAYERWVGNFSNYFILPHGLSDDQRDLLLWAYEQGMAAGTRRGTETLQRSLRDLMGVKP